jgi:hypothetical protein
MKNLSDKTNSKLAHNPTGELVKVFTKENNKEHKKLNQQYKDEYDDWHPHY